MSFMPDSPQGKSIQSGGSRRHVGEPVVRRLSRGSGEVTGESPYIPCMWVVELKLVPPAVRGSGVTWV